MTRRYVPPGLSSPQINSAASLKKWADQVTSILSVGTGQLGDSLDEYVTYRSLFEAGLTKEYIDGVYQAWGGNNSTGTIPSTADGPANYDIPPAPTGLVAGAGIGLNILQWTNPATLYSNHSYTEVWRSATNNLGAAARIGSTDFYLYPDSIGDTNVVYYYWIRFVSKANKFGPYNAGATSGVVGTTAYVVASDILVANLSAINADMGSITAGTITGGTIRTAATGARLVMNASDFIGYNSSNVAKTTISGSTGLLTAVDANITGTLTATAGVIGGATITATEMKNGTNIAIDWSNKKISINSATYGAQGIQLDYNGGTPRAYVGDGANKYLSFDGTDVKLGRDSKLLGADAYNNDNIYWNWGGDSVDGWSKQSDGTGTFDIATFGYFQIGAVATSGSYFQLHKRIPTGSGTWSKNSSLKYYFSPGTVQTNIQHDSGLGWVGNSAAQSIGFRLKPGSLLIYAQTRGASATTETSLSTTLVAGTFYLLEIVYISGTSAKFYIDGVLKHTATTNLPSGTSEANMIFQAQIINNAATTGSDGSYYGIKYLRDE